MDLIRIAVLLVLAVIVISLGSALFHLVSGKGDSRRMLRALTLRIALSVALFVLLMLGWYLGLIQPHSMQPGR